MTSFDISDNYLNTAHLLRRAAFGASPVVVEAASLDGLSATTDRLVNYESTPDPIDDEAILIKLQVALPEQIAARAGDRLPVDLIKLWWTYRLIGSPRPLQEKMTLFWHNHFTSKDDGFSGDVMYRQNQLYRRHALGNFRELTLAVAKDPEMLRYLNGNQNYKAHPNENFARELMEIFTCGRVNPAGQPNYTEDDVKAGARAFSGWNSRGGQFFYNANQHDDSIKTFMGQTGNLNGDDIIDILVALPATANYICRKLFRYFAYENPEPDVMNALVATYYGSGYDIKAIVSLILRSQAFYSDEARFALIKSPVDYIVGTIRMAGIGDYFTPPPDELTEANDVSIPLVGAGASPQLNTSPRPMRRGAMGLLAALVGGFRSMGQDLLAPPSVKGWDGGEFWINTDSLQARSKFAATFSRLPVLPLDQWQSPANGTQTIDYNETTVQAEDILSRILYQFGPLNPTPEERQILIGYAQTLRSANEAVRALLSLVLAMPDYQVF
jgi:uncharacterized protein (DUF1800 family)